MYVGEREDNRREWIMKVRRRTGTGTTTKNGEDTERQEK